MGVLFRTLMLDSRPVPNKNLREDVMAKRPLAERAKMPKRIQRKRTKGWRLPRNAVCVTRPGPFGNPYKGPGAVSAFREMVEQMQKAMAGQGGLLPHIGPDYESVLSSVQEHARRLVERLPELRGKNLACWCPLDRECHADVLLELANR